MPQSQLTILQVSPNDRAGGAELVAADLHLALLDRGVDAWIALGVSHGDLPNSLQIPNNERRSAWARAVLKAAGLYDPAAEPSMPALLRRTARFAAEPARYAKVLLGMEDFDFPGTAVLPDLTPRTPDVLHLHNLHGSYFDIRALPRLSRRSPIVITMHDAWLLTGHCAHPIDCLGWLEGCEECPTLDRYVPLARDRSDGNLRVKRDAIAGAHVRLATPSRWLKGLVERSAVADSVAELRVIPNGVDTGVFHPGDRAEARRKLGLPVDALIVVFAARSPRSSDFKDFETLARALPVIAAAVPDRKLLMLAVGQESADEDAGGVFVRHVPFVEDRSELAEYYRAADLYVHPARAENLPLAILEAMACGTPVVASRVGGIPEAVDDGVGGILVEPGDPKALAAAAVRVLSDETLRASLSQAGAKRAREEFPFERQADAYLAWYREIAEERAGR